MKLSEDRVLITKLFNWQLLGGSLDGDEVIVESFEISLSRFLVRNMGHGLDH